MDSQKNYLIKIFILSLMLSSCSPSLEKRESKTEEQAEQVSEQKEEVQDTEEQNPADASVNNPQENSQQEEANPNQNNDSQPDPKKEIANEVPPKPQEKENESLPEVPAVNEVTEKGNVDKNLSLSQELEDRVLVVRKKADEIYIQKLLLSSPNPENFGSQFFKYSRQSQDRSNVMNEAIQADNDIQKNITDLYEELTHALQLEPNNTKLLNSLGRLEIVILESYPDLPLSKDKKAFTQEELYMNSYNRWKLSLDTDRSQWVPQLEIAQSYLDSERLKYLTGINGTEAEVHSRGWTFVLNALLLLDEGIKNAQSAIAQESNSSQQEKIKRDLVELMTTLGKQYEWRADAISEVYNERITPPLRSVTKEELVEKGNKLYLESFKLTPNDSIAAYFYSSSQIQQKYNQRNKYYDGDRTIKIMPANEAQSVNWPLLSEAVKVIIKDSTQLLIQENFKMSVSAYYRQLLLVNIQDGVVQGKINYDAINEIQSDFNAYIKSIKEVSEDDINSFEKVKNDFISDAEKMISGEYPLKHN